MTHSPYGTPGWETETRTRTEAAKQALRDNPDWRELDDDPLGTTPSVLLIWALCLLPLGIAALLIWLGVAK